MNALNIVLLAVGLVAGAIVGMAVIFALKTRLFAGEYKKIDSFKADLSRKAQDEAENHKKQVAVQLKEEFIEWKNEYNRKQNEKVNKLNQTEKRLLQKEENLDKRYINLDNKEKELKKK
jgi:ribonuclease Y